MAAPLGEAAIRARVRCVEVPPCPICFRQVLRSPAGAELKRSFGSYFPRKSGGEPRAQMELGEDTFVREALRADRGNCFEVAKCEGWVELS